MLSAQACNWNVTLKVWDLLKQFFSKQRATVSITYLTFETERIGFFKLTKFINKLRNYLRTHYFSKQRNLGFLTVETKCSVWCQPDFEFQNHPHSYIRYKFTPTILWHTSVFNQAESVCYLLSWVNKMATLRRSSAKLRSLGSGHADLILAISQWKELRSATKSLMAAQESTSNDLLKWSSKEVCSTYLLRQDIIWLGLEQFLNWC